MRGLPQWKHFDVRSRCCLDGIVQCCRHLTECHGFKIPVSLLYLFCLHLGWLSLFNRSCTLTWDSPRKYAPLESMVKGVSSGGRGKCPSPEAWYHGCNKWVGWFMAASNCKACTSERRDSHMQCWNIFSWIKCDHTQQGQKTFKDWLPKTAECKMMWPPTFLSIYMCAADHNCLFFLNVLNLVVVWPRSDQKPPRFTRM